MKEVSLDEANYKLPGGLSAFQRKLYRQLVAWKHINICREPGLVNGREYDAVLPPQYRPEDHLLYPPIRQRFLDHQKKHFFKFHRYMNHMASSQAACANLFLPLLKETESGAAVLRTVKPDLKSIATGYLDSGFRIEFWDEPDNMLNDHNLATGTDADFAIAYYDFEGRLKLWLIEHKLSEREFTPCGAYSSKGRTAAHRCSPTADVMQNPELCYYHKPRGYRYWDLTLKDARVFKLEKIAATSLCPFKGGMNQLWRNMLLARAIEESNSAAWPYTKVYFSVVVHPENHSLDRSMNAFKQLLSAEDRFFSFTSRQLVDAAARTDSAKLRAWAEWYMGLYYW